MTNPRRNIIALAAGVAAIFIFLNYYGGEKARIKKQFSRLEDCFHKERGEALLSTGLKMRSLQGFIAPQCEVQVLEAMMSGIFTPAESAANAMRVREIFSELSLRFYNLDIESPQKDEARVSFKVRLTGKNSRDELFNEIRQFQCVMRKIDGQWLFSRCEEVETLKK